MAALDDTAHVNANTSATGNVSAGAVNDSERPCPLCGTHEAHPFLRADDPKFSVVVCAKCGLRYTRPLPNEGELAALYTENYYVRNSPRLLSADTFRRLFQYSVLWQHRRAFAERRSGRILDVGCGDGNFLTALKTRGWEVYGTEFSPDACDLAREKGVAVQQGDLLSAAFPDGFFDVVTLWHVFEHLPEPRNELAEIQRILSSNGLLIIEVPNSGSLGFRLTKRKWYHFDVPRHLQHFTPETLRQILLNASFHTVRTQQFHHWDFTTTVYSLLNRLGVQERLGIRDFSTKSQTSTLLDKGIFLLLACFLSVICLPCSIGSTLLTRNGESMTITCRKVRP